MSPKLFTLSLPDLVSYAAQMLARLVDDFLLVTTVSLTRSSSQPPLVLIFSLLPDAQDKLKATRFVRTMHAGV